MLDFPVDYPADAGKIVIDHQAGIGNTPCCDVERAGWNLYGYLAGQRAAQKPVPQPPTGTPVPAKLQAVACSEADLCNHLKTLESQSANKGQMRSVTIP